MLHLSLMNCLEHPLGSVNESQEDLGLCLAFKEELVIEGT